ncbi:hypothetical protein B9479_004626 [Cryptococcus floricola]|uniref:Phosphatidylinositol glycan, class F n=1 Tax=Cryptococcus floricola TaxID=2591691 RepID=A0A5D3AT65_9TREE|nr:hypothetical protein B9479_004626 [Cryptococcus floricola]
MSTPTFLLHEYFGLLIYLAILLPATFISLPHSTSYFIPTSSPLTQTSSADRPEHAFLTPITARPAVTMLWDVVGMGVVMVWWGGRMKGWFEGKGDKKVGGDRVVGESELEERQGRTKKMLGRLYEAGVSTLAGSLVFYVILSLMGAPLNSHWDKTALLALHLSILTVLPVVYTLGMPSLYDKGTYARFRMTRLFCEFKPETPLERALVYPAVGTLTGAWLGALPIPLDWDRPWQSFPLTIAFASILGFVAGGFVSWGHTVAEGMYNEVAEKAKPVGVEEEKAGKKNKKKKAVKA